MKETLKEINAEASSKLSYTFEFADDLLEEYDEFACTSSDCGEICGCYSHFDGPSLFHLDPVLFPFSSYLSS